jgi:hypothetical protein
MHKTSGGRIIGFGTTLRTRVHTALFTILKSLLTKGLTGQIRMMYQTKPYDTQQWIDNTKAHRSAFKSK